MSTKIQKCECGRTWQLTRVKVIARDNDSIDCLCGRELISWNGGHMFTAAEVQRESVSCPKGHVQEIWVRVDDQVRKLHQFACMECYKETRKSGEFHRKSRTPVGFVSK